MSSIESPSPSLKLAAHVAETRRRLAALWGEPELVVRPRVELSTLMFRSLGRCYPERELVRVASWVLEMDDALIEEVLVHELAHVVVHWRAKRGGAAGDAPSGAAGHAGRRTPSRERPHGASWRALMREAGLDPRVRLSLEGLELPAEYRERAEARRRGGGRRARPLYLHTCPRCGASRPARRRVPQWRCATCVEAGRAGELVITRLEATAGRNAGRREAAPRRQGRTAGTKKDALSERGRAPGGSSRTLLERLKALAERCRVSASRHVEGADEGLHEGSSEAWREDPSRRDPARPMTPSRP